MDFIKNIRIGTMRLARIHPARPGIYLVSLATLWLMLAGCEPQTHDSNWVEEEEMRTIGTYLDQHQQEYEKFYAILEQEGLLSTLYGYNPYGEGYTLFLPTDGAIDRFVGQEDYRDFGDLLLDTAFLHTLTRYHTVNKKLHTNEFPYGALTDPTLTGDRLTIGFYTVGDNPLFKVNNNAPITESNLDMTNGYIHVVSEVLRKPELSGVEWLRQDDRFSILAGAMELSGISDGLWFSQYTILAEQDSIYRKYGINTVEDLVDRLEMREIPDQDPEDALYQFVAYHILYRDLYLNDFELGTFDYWTMGNESVTIEVGLDIRINPGMQVYRMDVSESGDTTIIDYIDLVLEDCNIMTRTGPVHSLTELLVSEPLPEAR